MEGADVNAIIFYVALALIAWLLMVGAAFRARPRWRQWRSERTPRTGERGGSDTAAVG